MTASLFIAWAITVIIGAVGVLCTISAAMPSSIKKGESSSLFYSGIFLLVLAYLFALIGGI